MRVLGFTGMPGAGKSEAVAVAKGRDIPVLRMGDLVWDEVKKRALPLEDRYVGHVANEMRTLYGPDVWAVRTANLARAYAEERSLIVIDGIRSRDEVEAFQRELGKDFVLVAIHASRDTRHTRLGARSRIDEAPDTKQMTARDDRELSWGIGTAIAMADEVIDNSGGIEDLRDQVAALLDRHRAGGAEPPRVPPQRPAP